MRKGEGDYTTNSHNNMGESLLFIYLQNEDNFFIHHCLKKSQNVIMVIMVYNFQFYKFRLIVLKKNQFDLREEN